ncbi:hypothetical protein D3C71_1147930 [compost metagenome]
MPDVFIEPKLPILFVICATSPLASRMKVSQKRPKLKHWLSSMFSGRLTMNWSSFTRQ